MLKSLDEIKTVLNLHHRDIRERYKVKEIGIFGSFVRGEQKKRSDVDILVEFTKKDIPDLLKLIELERYLQKLLKKKVDLVRKGGIRPELKESILKEVVYL
ncbi:MAG: nucleotidyltransferase family protein [Deltaproteobacteria bacterium]